MSTKHKWLLATAVAIVVIAATIMLNSIDKQTLKTESKIKQLQQTGKELELQRIKEKQNQDSVNGGLQKQIEQLKKDLQAKAEAKKQNAVASLFVPQVQAASPSDAKMWIYMHESGNRTTAVNSIGCRGLGQACPGSKLPCGDDYACQDAWFTNYMLNRYGTWENAKAFWLAHHWW